jgi:K+-transporting ATPase ATPase C chain
MELRKHIYPAFLITIVLTFLLGIVYPLVLTGLSQVLFKDKAEGSLITRDGKVIGSRLIGQSFTGASYFHSRPSAAGTGYDATASNGTNLGPTSSQLLETNVKTAAAAAQADNPDSPIPVDLVTSSASGLDPHISPAAAEFQVARVAKARDMGEDEVRRLVREHTEGRDLGILGEPRVNVLELNLALDGEHPLHEIQK